MCNDFIFRTEKKNEVILLSRTGMTKNCKSKLNGKLVIPQFLIHQKQSYTICKIGHDCFAQSPFCEVIILAEISDIEKGAFSMCKHLNHVDLSRTNVSKIPENCFIGCTSLTSVLLPKNITQLGICSFSETALDSFEFDEQIKMLGSFCFMNNIHLNEADLSKLNITSLPSGFFKGCTSLTSIIFPPTLRCIENYSLSGTSITEIALSESIQSLGDGAFSNCSQITTIELEHLNLSTLSSYLFFGCTKLTRVTLPKGIKVLSPHVFEKTQISSLTFPTSLKIISTLSFEGCKRIEDIDLRNTSVEEIHEGAFENCTSLKNILLPLTLKRLDGCLLGSGIQKVDFATSQLSEIPSMMFYQCSLLKYVAFPTNIKRINDKAFAKSSIVEIDLSNSNLEFIGKSCFEGSSLALIKLPNTVKYISERAFAATKISSFIGHHNLSYIGQGCFSECKFLENVDLFETSIEVLFPMTFMFNNALKEFKAPPLVEIYERAFFQCALQELRFGDELISLHPLFASQMKHLKTIDLSLCNITELNSTLFDGCENLRHILMPIDLRSLKNAALFNCGIIELKLDPEIEEVGEMALAHCEKLEVVDLSATKISFISDSLFEGDQLLQEIRWPFNVTKIGRMAFKNCGFVDITIPSSITFIAIGAFSYNKELQSVSMSMCKLKTLNKHLFSQCINLHRITFPLTLNTLKTGVFNNTKINKLKLPSTIVSASNCFGKCPFLVSLDLSLTQITVITKELFEYCPLLSNLILPFNLTAITEYSFKGTSIETINIPPRCALDKFAFAGSQIRKIDLSKQQIAILPPGIFKDCYHLTEIKLPHTLESLQPECFENAGFASLTLENLKEIAEGAIKCHRLVTLNISNTKIETLESLEGCVLLEEIYLPPTLKTLSTNCLMRTNIKNIVLPESVNTIENGAFLDCVHLKSVDISATSIKVIEGDLFFNCISLVNIKWNNKVTTLSEHSFSNTGFIVFNVPPSIEKILTFCFFKCNSLKIVNFNNSKVTHFADSLFQGCKSLEIIYFANKTYKWGRSVFAQTGIKHIKLPVSSGELRLVFDGCKSLRGVDLSKSKITLLHERVFGGCSSLRVVVLPPELEMVSMIAFQGCYKIEEVYYFGITCFSNLRLFQCHPKIFVGRNYNCKTFDQSFPEIITNFTVDVYEY